MKHKLHKTPEYVNVEVAHGGGMYRVCIHRSGRPLVVARKTKHHETPLRLERRTAQALIRIARDKIAGSTMPDELKLDTTQAKLQEALDAWGNGVAVTDEQVILLDNAHRVFVGLYRTFDPSPNLRLNQEQFTRLRERRKL